MRVGRACCPSEATPISSISSISFQPEAGGGSDRAGLPGPSTLSPALFELNQNDIVEKFSWTEWCCEDRQVLLW